MVFRVYRLSCILSLVRALWGLWTERDIGTMQHVYRTHAQVSDERTLMLEDLPFAAGEAVEVIIIAERAPENGGSLVVDESAATEPASTDALAVLEKLIGTVEEPADWAAEHDHDLYRIPKRGAP